MIRGARAHACRVRIVENTGLGWTNAKWGGPPGPRPTPSSACCWYLSMLEAAGPGGPARTRGGRPTRWPKDFIPWAFTRVRAPRWTVNEKLDRDYRGGELGDCARLCTCAAL